MRNMFTYASRYKRLGVERVYSYNFFGIETDASCASTCQFDAGLVDTFRHIRPTEQKYSWWSQVTSARERNIGWRLDYIFVSRNLLPYVVDADIHCDVYGSDHCPVSLTLSLPLEAQG